MTPRPTTAFALAAMFAAGVVLPPATRAASAQEPGSITGTAHKEAKKPFPEYTVRVRNVQLGTIAATVQLDPSGVFTLTGITPSNYLVELIDPKGKVVCTEGPFDLAKQPARTGVTIECGKPAAWWLLAAAGLAGITAGIVTNDSASPAR